MDTRTGATTVTDVKGTNASRGNAGTTSSPVATSTAFATIPEAHPWSSTDASLPTMISETRNYEKLQLSTIKELEHEETKIPDTPQEDMTTISLEGELFVTATAEKCGFTYNSKCFRAIVYKTWNVTFSDAQSLCGNNLANIYNAEHYRRMQDYLRSMIPDGLTFIAIYTGMTYKNEGQLLTTSGEGVDLSEELWHPAFPYPSASNLRVGIDVNRLRTNQGIINREPTYKLNGAICEFNL
ncbi:uncharacterized protein LOC120345638 [Styela clava]